MSQTLPAYHVFPLGDSALTVDFGNHIDERINRIVLGLVKQVKQSSFPGIIEVFPAYSSLTICYDVLALSKNVSGEMTVFDWLKKKVQGWISSFHDKQEEQQRTLDIPVCYDKQFAPDLGKIAHDKHLSVEEFIQIHTSATYRVYMLGFLPGFAYMGDVDERIATPRKLQPANVAAGSVGIAARQTGIYPLSSPGGWQIIGRTPLQLFDAGNREMTLFKPGDLVKFVPITINEFTDH